MTRILTSMGLSVQIGLAVLLPILGMIALAALMIRQGAEDFTVQSHEGIESGGLVELVDLTPVFADLLAKLQEERGRTALQLSDGGGEAALENAVAATEATRQVMATALTETPPTGFGTKYAADVDAIRASLDGLAELRTKVAAGDISPEEAVAQYNALNAQILKLMEYAARLGSDADISDAMTAYTALLQATEYLGQERSLGGIGFSMGFFDTPTYRRFVQVMNAREGSLELFRRYASVPEVEFYEQTMQGPAVEEVDRMTQVVIEYATTGNTGDIEGPQWFDAVSSELALMHEVEARVGNNLTDLVMQKEAAFEDRMTFSAGLCVVLVLVAAIFSFFVARSFISAVKRLTGTMEAAAAGDYGAEVKDTNRRDEIGAMARTVEVFKDAVKRADELGKEQAAERERQREAAESRAQTLGRLTSEFDEQASAALQGFMSAAEQLSQLSERMSGSADEATTQSNAAANASEMAAQNVQNVASAAEELSASISEISRQVAQGTTMTSAAVGEAERADRQVQSLSEAAQKIGDVVKLINDIAGQTNLLALNATIEAARAGAAGKGFAVVAAEVKTLSNETARATDDIRERIAALRDETATIVASMEQGTSAVAAGQAAMQEVDGRIGQVSAAIEQTSERMAEIAGILTQQTSAANEVSAGVARIAERSAENSRQIMQNVEATRGVEKLLGQQLQELFGQEIPDKLLKIAKVDHILWKKRLADMLVGLESLRADELSSHESCRLGKWYYGDGAADWRGHPAYRALEAPHKEVHRCGKAAASAFAAGRSDEALRHVAEVEKASAEVVDLLDRMLADRSARASTG